MADLTMLMELCKIWHSAISAASHAHTHTHLHTLRHKESQCVSIQKTKRKMNELCDIV